MKIFSSLIAVIISNLICSLASAGFEDLQSAYMETDGSFHILCRSSDSDLPWEKVYYPDLIYGNICPFQSIESPFISIVKNSLDQFDVICKDGAVQNNLDLDNVSMACQSLFTERIETTVGLYGINYADLNEDGSFAVHCADSSLERSSYVNLISGDVCPKDKHQSRIRFLRRDSNEDTTFKVVCTNGDQHFSVPSSDIKSVCVAGGTEDYFIQLSSNARTNCALKKSGALKCWGYNKHKESTVPQDLPRIKQVSTRTSGACAVDIKNKPLCWKGGFYQKIPKNIGLVKQISGGRDIACAITLNNDLKCWAFSEEASDKNKSVVGEYLAEADPFVSVKVASNRFCAIRESGKPLCKGKMPHALYAIPGHIAKLKLKKIALFDYAEHACAIDTDRKLHCWGNNKFGQTDIPTNLGKVIDVSIGTWFTCAAKEQGGVTCWIKASNQTPETNTPIDLEIVNQLTTGAGHGCVLDILGQIHCWGTNHFGESNSPKDLHKVQLVSSGRNQTCVIRSSDKPYCWGNNGLETSVISDHGQDTVPDDLIIAVEKIDTGYNHNCFISKSNEVRCWGSNYLGTSEVPMTLGPVREISAGGGTCAIKKAGGLQCWGYQFKDVKIPFDESKSIEHISTGQKDFVCGFDDNGTVKCWGNNKLIVSNIPTDLGPVKQIASGYHHVCVLKITDEVECWGEKDLQPNVPKDLGEVKLIASKNQHTCALNVEDKLFCWGLNHFGQTDVPDDLGKVAQVSTGEDHTCALEESGSLRCWGVFSN